MNETQLMANNITPFTGHPAANLAANELTAARYGLQPHATPLLAELAQTMHAALEKCQPHALSAAAKACRPARAAACSAGGPGGRPSVGLRIFYSCVQYRMEGT